MAASKDAGSKRRRGGQHHDVRAWGEGEHALRTYRFLQVTLGTALRGLLRTSREGVEKIPKTGPVILVTNHVSNIDPVCVVVSLNRPVFHLAKHTLFTKPFRSWFFQTLGGQIPVRRGERGSNEAAVQAAVNALRKGAALGIYPEAHRSKTGKLHRGRPGVGRIALLTGVPVYPVAVQGTFKVWPKGKKVPRLLVPTKVIVGDALHFPKDAKRAADTAECQRVTDQVMVELAKLLGQHDYHPDRADWAHP